MCTSFVLYSDRTYIGMNFDISDRPISLSLKQNDQFLVQQKENSQFFPAFGLNKSGVFINLLMVEPNEAGKYRRGKNCIHIIKFFEDVLGGQTEIDKLLQEKTVVNTPGISVHSMVIVPNYFTGVVEPGRGNIHLNAGNQPFLTLTNFPLSDFTAQKYTEVTGDGSDRYIKCYGMLQENQHHFDINQGFAILEATAQAEGGFPTQFSLLAVPEEQCIHFVIGRNFSRRFVFSFLDNTIQAADDFEKNNSVLLDNNGILLAELINR